MRYCPLEVARFGASVRYYPAEVARFGASVRYCPVGVARFGASVRYFPAAVVKFGRLLAGSAIGGHQPLQFWSSWSGFLSGGRSIG